MEYFHDLHGIFAQELQWVVSNVAGDEGIHITEGNKTDMICMVNLPCIPHRPTSCSLEELSYVSHLLLMFLMIPTMA